MSGYRNSDSSMLCSSEPRLFCDAMLAGLARWLRAAGHDTAMAPAGANDRVILAICRNEARTLITRDRHLVTHARRIEHVLLAAEGLDAQAKQLTQALCIDWTRAPFTRCLLDNSPLREAAPEEYERIPPRARELPGPLRACPCCGRIYWPGSHVRRMQSRLEYWRGLARPEASV